MPMLVGGSAVLVATWERLYSKRLFLLQKLQELFYCVGSFSYTYGVDCKNLSLCSLWLRNGFRPKSTPAKAVAGMTIRNMSHNNYIKPYIAAPSCSCERPENTSGQW